MFLSLVKQVNFMSRTLTCILLSVVFPHQVLASPLTKNKDVTLVQSDVVDYQLDGKRLFALNQSGELRVNEGLSKQADWVLVAEQVAMFHADSSVIGTQARFVYLTNNGVLWLHTGDLASKAQVINEQLNATVASVKVSWPYIGIVDNLNNLYVRDQSGVWHHMASAIESFDLSGDTLGFINKNGGYYEQPLP